MTALDVTAAAYTAAVGRPYSPHRSAGGCARCAGTTETMTPTGQVVSRRFTGYETWTNLPSRALCEVCVWAYRHLRLRSCAHIITADPPAMLEALPTQLRKVLAQPLPAGIAVTVPARLWRKHLLPDARWGQICVDGVNITWRTEDAQRLAVMCSLRELGFTEQDLRAPAPPHRVLRTLEHRRWAQILEDWETLVPWRSAPSWWITAARASEPDHTRT